MVSVVVISKDEPALADTLAAVEAQLPDTAEVLVVDASEGRLEHIRRRHPSVRWIDFEPPPGVRISIPHQRNRGVREAHGDVIVFTDAGCLPREGWLARLVAPILAGEETVAAGPAFALGDGTDIYDQYMTNRASLDYLEETPTINLAFRKSAFHTVGGFDEGFMYGSDVDFTWRLGDAGFAIRNVHEAVVDHDWGSNRRQVRRSFLYGRGRAHLYLKHRRRMKRVPLKDPIALVYPLFLLGLPLALRFPLYPALLAVPAWRNRRNGALRVIANHLAYGAGVLAEVTGL